MNSCSCFMRSRNRLAYGLGRRPKSLSLRTPAVETQSRSQLNQRNDSGITANEGLPSDVRAGTTVGIGTQVGALTTDRAAKEARV
jgi:hypothetical protein